MRLVFLVLILAPFLIFAQDHLVITEIQTVPIDSSFIEIYNPTLNTFELDSVYFADHNTYYQIAESNFTSNSQDFLVKFPDGTSLASKSAAVIALNGTAFEAKYGFSPDYEILGTSASVPDMIGQFVGASAQLSAHEMLALFRWDGNSDLVQDIDYVAWGLFTTTFVDKSGIAIDGPDAGTDSSSYFSDTPVVSQTALASLSSETQSIQRIGIAEGNETASGGNGLTGHDETSEDLTNQFTLANPTPGVVQEVPGDGSGTVTVAPDSIETSNSSNFDFTFTGEGSYTLDKVQITIPANWSWSGQASDVSISGTGFSGSTISVNGDDILIESTAVTTTATGTITIQNLTSPAERGNSIFTANTTVAGGNLAEIQNSPRVMVWALITIADIQNDPTYIGISVSLEAIVTLGSGIAATDWTDAYIQDNSGRGINVYQSGTPVDPDLVRGNKIQITGTVDEYGGVTEIIDYSLTVLSTGQPLPNPIILTTSTANDVTYEGTYVQIKGIVSDKFSGGGGTTFRINDGSGETVIRAWDSAGLSLGSYNVNDTISVKGIMDIYQSSAQILLSYQDDIDFTTIEIAGEGSGEAVVTPDSVSTGDLVSLDFSFTGTSNDTVSQIEITIPQEWNWTSNVADVTPSGGPFNSTNISVNANIVTISDAVLENNIQGSIIINNLTAPSVDTVSQFIVKTGNASRVVDIENQPIVLVGAGTQVATTPISLIQTDPSWIGQTITIKGVVSIGAGILRNDRTDAYIQDSTGYGLNVFSFDPPDPGIVKGNLLLMTGLVEEYQGTTEITNYSYRILRKNSAIPGIKEITTNAATSDTSLEGSYIKVSGTIIDNYYAGGGTNIIMDDGSGEVFLRIWDTAELDLSSFEIGDGIVAYGVIDIYNGAGQVMVGYQGDIQHIVLPRVPQFLKLPNKPFVPDRGEILVIRYSAGSENTQTTMRVYDLSGRLVTTLLDGSGRSFEQQIKWNGRDLLNDFVPLGTYILHYEVVNNSTGKRWQKAAPIVVGTVLK